MKRSILLLVLILGSFGYGVMAMRGVVTGLLARGDALHQLQDMAAEAAASGQAVGAMRVHRQFLHSWQYAAQVGLAFLAGLGFLAGAVGLICRRTWAVRVMSAGAWFALTHMAWIMVVSLEVYRSTGVGMAYQLSILNMLWVVFVLAIGPLERVRKLVEPV